MVFQNFDPMVQHHVCVLFVRFHANSPRYKSPRIYLHSKARPAVELEIKNGDDFLDQIEFGRIDLLKVDVEGFEPYVFRGLQNRIMNDRPVILTEISAASRNGFGSDVFRETFYKGAKFAAVTGRLGRTYKLRPFVYASSGEVLIVPPEMGDFADSTIQRIIE
jgi:hypothetical protein